MGRPFFNDKAIDMEEIIKKHMSEIGRKGGEKSKRKISSEAQDKMQAGRNKKHWTTTHGMSYAPEYSVWAGMKARCNSPKNKDYSRYGGRGISVCDEWMECFENFFEDMGLRPSDDYSIDRIDNHGDYTPDNCRWATRKQQQNNRRSNNMIEYNGEWNSISQWARIRGMSRNALYHRIRKGMGIKEALFTPVKKSKNDNI